MKLAKSPVALAVALSILSTSSIVLAEEQNNEDAVEVITVKSDFRNSNLMTKAASISILSQDNIDLRHAQNLEDILVAIPNVNIAGGTQRVRYFQIRGIGERSQYVQTINPSVGLIVDDIDFSGIGGVSSTYDISQVEVYRGPQGTRFGSNALAGLVYMNSYEPTDEFESSLRLKAGNYNSFGASAVVSGPASDSVNYRLTAEKYKSDGYVHNGYLNKDDTNNQDELSLKGKVSIEASNDWQIDLSLIHHDFDNGYDTFSLDNNRTTLSDEPGFDKQKTTAGSAKFTYSGYDAFEVLSVFSVADSTIAYGYDEDWAYVGIHPWEYSSTDHYFRDNKNMTGEIRLTSEAGHEIFGGKTAWVAGAYIKRYKENLKREYTYLDEDYFSRHEANTYALFGELETKLNNKLTLTTGLRVEKRKDDYVNTDGIDANPSETMVGGNIVLSYSLNDSNMLYANISRGFKAGGFNSSGTLPADKRYFESEYLWNYELGYKASFDAYNAYLRTSVFHMKRDNIQINSYQTLEREDGSSEFIQFWDNAAKGYNQGVEVEGGLFLTENLEFYGSLGLLKTEFSGYVHGDGRVETGRDQAHAPNYQYSIGATYYWLESFEFNLSVDGKDAYFFSASHNERSDAMSVLNGSVAYIQEDWQVKLWGRNMLDKTYQTRGFYFGNDPRDGYTDKAYYHFGEPAVFGVTFDYSF